MKDKQFLLEAQYCPLLVRPIPIVRPQPTSTQMTVVARKEEPRRDIKEVDNRNNKSINKKIDEMPELYPIKWTRGKN